MSRHRLVKNLDLNGDSVALSVSSRSQSSMTEELDDEAISDGGDDEVSAEDYGTLEYFV